MELLRQPGCWLRSSHTFNECVIAHWSSDSAPKIIGAQAYHRSFGIVTVTSVFRGGRIASAAKRMSRCQKPSKEERDIEVTVTIGRGAMCIGRSTSGSLCGQYTRENAGMSSESIVRIYAVESLRIPGEGSSTQGKSGPKPRT